MLSTMGTVYTDKGEKPAVGTYDGFDHCTLWVGNAKQAADWYNARMGFRTVAYRGLETGDRDVVSYVLKQGEVRHTTLDPRDLRLTGSP